MNDDMYVHDRAPYILLDKSDAMKKYAYEQQQQQQRSARVKTIVYSHHGIKGKSLTYLVEL